MKTAYYDTSYLLKLQCAEEGTTEVRAHAGTVGTILCCLHGRAEFASACHRKIREGAATLPHLMAMLAQLRADASAGALAWLPVSEAMIARVEACFSAAPTTTVLRAADALHLACAAEHGLSEIFSNDRKLLAAAPLFGLRGVNVIPA
jgi:predicted nucleic acid-binding protein